MYGNAGFDTMHGEAGNDLMFGGASVDWLYGGEGNNTISGEGGADGMYGGAGADSFRYWLAAESTATLRDTIYDFEKGVDEVDLLWADANSTVAGNQAFTLFAAKPFAPTAGALWQDASTSGMLIRGDVNGDGYADLEILLSGIATPLAAGDFIL